MGADIKRESRESRGSRFRERGGKGVLNPFVLWHYSNEKCIDINLARFIVKFILLVYLRDFYTF